MMLSMSLSSLTLALTSAHNPDPLACALQIVCTPDCVHSNLCALQLAGNVRLATLVPETVRQDTTVRPCVV